MNNQYFALLHEKILSLLIEEEMLVTEIKCLSSEWQDLMDIIEALKRNDNNTGNDSCNKNACKLISTENIIWVECNTTSHEPKSKSGEAWVHLTCEGRFTIMSENLRHIFILLLNRMSVSLLVCSQTLL